MRKRKLLSFVSVFMCSVMVFTGTSLNTIKQKNMHQVTYSILKTTSKTMSKTKLKKNKVVKVSMKTSDVMAEPYYAKQWALHNDGTFVPETSNQNIHIPDFDFSDSWDDFFDLPPQRGIRFHIDIPDMDDLWNDFGFYFPYNRGCKSNVYSPYSQRSRLKYYYKGNQKTAVNGFDISAPQAWDTVGNNGRDVVVAVIDTGFDFTHEELSNAAWKNSGEIAGDGIDNDKNGYIDDVYGWNFYENKPNTAGDINSDYDHGTHVAGIIAAERNQKGIAGIIGNNKVKIMDLKALGGSDGGGETENVIKAIKYAQAMGASICNLSFGTSDYDDDLYNAMKDSNMLFVCAAGNGNNLNRGYNSDITPTYPASFDLDNIISVANLSYDGTLDTTSNYGKTSVDIAAPGAYIISSVAGNKYAYMSGSSMAAPMVTAVAAMVYSYHKDYTLTQTKNTVLASAKQLSSLQDKVASSGMVNAYNAVIYK